MKSRSWFHWLAFIPLIICTTLIGYIYLANGASPGPYFFIDNIVIRALGVLFLASTLFILLKQKFGFITASISYVVAALEIIVSTLLETDLLPASATAIVCFTLLSLAGLTHWLSQYFCNKTTNA